MPDTEKTETVAEEVVQPIESEKQEEVEQFDQERAMETIKKQRESERKAIAEAEKLRKELAKFEEAEKKRKEAEMSEIDRLKAQYEEAQSKAAKLERESLQRKAADEAGLPVAFVDRIRGETLEDMITDAKGLLEAMPKGSKTNISTTNPGAGRDAKQTDEERLKRLGLR
jgi:hypothetical protein